MHYPSRVLVTTLTEYNIYRAVVGYSQVVRDYSSHTGVESLYFGTSAKTSPNRYQ